MMHLHVGRQLHDGGLVMRVCPESFTHLLFTLTVEGTTCTVHRELIGWMNKNYSGHCSSHFVININMHLKK